MEAPGDIPGEVDTSLVEADHTACDWESHAAGNPEHVRTALVGEDRSHTKRAMADEDSEHLHALRTDVRGYLGAELGTDVLRDHDALTVGAVRSDISVCTWQSRSWTGILISEGRQRNILMLALGSYPSVLFIIACQQCSRWTYP